jgi:ABC-2 type transport system permease protein
MLSSSGQGPTRPIQWLRNQIAAASVARGFLKRSIRYEWRNLTADRTTLAVAALLTVTIAYGIYNGSEWVKFQQRTIHALLSEERERLDAIRAEIPKIESGEKRVNAFSDPRLPQSLGRNMGLRYAVMPPGPLASLAIGQSDLNPYYFKVSTNSKQTFLNADEIENPMHLLAGRFDLAFVILYLCPLVILAFSYNLISAEKESGTLAMTMSQPVTLSRLVLLKVAIRASYIVALTVLLSLAAAAIGGADFSADGIALRLAYWIAVTSVYSLFWFAAAIAINALGRSSASNAIALAGIWLAFVVLIPSLLNVAVKAFFPVPSRIELIQAMRVAGEEATRNSGPLLARYLEDHPEMAPAAAKPGEPSAPDYGTLLIAINMETERSVQPVLGKFDTQISLQQRTVERFRYLSPAIAAQLAFNDLSGSSAHRYGDFLQQTDRYHTKWREFFNPRILRKQRVSVADIDMLPTFTYREEDFTAVGDRLSATLVGLLLFLAAGIGVSIVLLRRLPVAG